MICACGQSIPDSQSIVICDQCGNQNQNCPSCGGGMSYPPNLMAAECLYCSSELVHIDAASHPPCYPIVYQETDIANELTQFLKNRFGVPGDIAMKMSISSSQLTILPLLIQLESNKKPYEYANQEPWFVKKLPDSGVSLKAKVYMRPEYVQADLKKPIRSPGQNETLVYYPYYDITYRYKGSSYRAVMDAVNGSIAYAEHPVTKRTRGTLLVAGIAYLLITTLGSLFLFAMFRELSASGDLIFSGLSAGATFITGLIVGIMILTKVVIRHASKDEVLLHEGRFHAVRSDERSLITDRKLISARFSLSAPKA